MYETKIKTNHRVVSFLIVIAFVLSSMYQITPNFYLLATAREFSEIKLTWEDETQEQKTFAYDEFSKMEIKARLSLGFAEQDFNKPIVMPRYLYESHNGYPAPELDINPLKENFEISLDEENQNYSLIAKNFDNEIYCDVVYKSLEMQAVEENDFTISAIVGEVGNEISRAELSGRIAINDEENINADQQTTDAQEIQQEELPQLHEKIAISGAVKNSPLKTAGEVRNVLNFQWDSDNADLGKCTLVKNEQGYYTNANWTFTNQQYNAFIAHLEINTNRDAKMTIIVPKYAYQYRDGTYAGELNTSLLKREFNVNDNKDNTYTLSIKGEIYDNSGNAPHINAYLNYSSASTVRTISGTEFDISIKVISNDKPNGEIKTIHGSITTDINEITVTKTATKDITSTGKFTSLEELEKLSDEQFGDKKYKLLNDRYHITEADFNKFIDDAKKEDAYTKANKEMEVVFGDYLVKGDVSGCQPYKAMLKDTPTNGTVVAVQNGRAFLKKGDNLNLNPDGYYEFDRVYNGGTNSDSIAFTQAPQYRVLVMYIVPKGERNFKNIAEIKAEAIDTGTIVYDQAVLNHVDAEVDDDYDANIWGIQKGWFRTNQNATINMLERGLDKDFHFRVTGYANTMFYLNNVDKFNEYKASNDKPTFRAEVIDDVMFAKGTEDEYYQLTPSDYEYTKLEIYLKVAKMTGEWGDVSENPLYGGYNCENGRPKIENEDASGEKVTYRLNNATDGKISIQVKQGDNSSWITVLDKTDIAEVVTGTVKMQEKVEFNGTTVTRNDDGKITVDFGNNKDIYQVKVIYEETELQKNEIRVDLYGKWKGSGTTFTENAKSLFGKNDDSEVGTNENFVFVNWAGIQGFKNNDSKMHLTNHVGEQKDDWQNPTSAACISGGSAPKVIKFDKANYPSHGNSMCVIRPNDQGWSCKFIGDDGKDNFGCYDEPDVTKRNYEPAYTQRSGTTIPVYRTDVHGGAAKWHTNRNAETGEISYNIVAMQGNLAGTENDLQTAITNSVVTGTTKAVFYDLLPTGLIYDSVEPIGKENQQVELTNNGTYTWRLNDLGFVPEPDKIYGLKNYQNIRVDVTDNYNDSGRQFVKVTVEYGDNDFPMGYFKDDKGNKAFALFFSFKLNARTEDGGKFVRPNYTNYVAAQFYDKDNNIITIDNACVKPDNGEYFKGLETYFDNLDNDKSNDKAPTVVYADAYSSGNTDGNATVVSKAIKADYHDDYYKLSTDTDLGEGYTYRLKYSVFSGTSKNLAFYDVIENSTHDSSGKTPPENRWYGKLDYIDVSEAAEQHNITNPDKIEVYYNTNKLDETEDIKTNLNDKKPGLKPNNLTEENGWTKVSLDNDFKWYNNLEKPEDVKTIAVYFKGLEINSGVTGKDFIQIYLHMKASEIYADVENRAYNEVAYYNELNGETDGSTQFGNAVDIGLKKAEKSFSITKNFVNKENQSNSYYGEVKFEIRQIGNAPAVHSPFKYGDAPNQKGNLDPADTNVEFEGATDTNGNWSTEVDNTTNHSATLTMHFKNQDNMTANNFVKAKFKHEGIYTFEVTETQCTGIEEYKATKSEEKYTITVDVKFTDIGNTTYDITETTNKKANLEDKTGVAYTEKQLVFTNTVTGEPQGLTVETPFKIRKTFAGTGAVTFRVYIEEDSGNPDKGTLKFKGNYDTQSGKNMTLDSRVSGRNTNDKTNKAEINMPLSSTRTNPTVEYTNITVSYINAGSYSYIVSEYIGNNNKYEFDESKYKVTINVVEDGNGKLKINSKTVTKLQNRDGTTTDTPKEIYSLIDGGEIPVINFTNAPKDPQDTAGTYANITIGKTFYDYKGENVDSSSGRDFEFEVKSYDDFSGNTIIEDKSTSASTSDEALGNQTYTVNVVTTPNSGNVTTGASNKIKFKFSQKGIYRYLIKEKEPTDNIEGKQWFYDQSVYLVEFNVYNSNKGELAVGSRKQYKLVDSDGTPLEKPELIPNDIKSLPFTNKLGAIELAPPVVKKNVTTLYPDSKYNQDIDEKGYGFILQCNSHKKSEGGEASVPNNATQTLTITTDGTASGTFDKVLFWEEGIYEFEISERNVAYAKCDTAKYIWTVTVTKDADGKFTYTDTIKKDGEDANKIEFNNQYINNGIVEVSVRKKLVGMPMSDEEKGIRSFDFEIKAVTKNAPLPDNPKVTVTFGKYDDSKLQTDKDNKKFETSDPVSFGVIKFTKEGTYQYEISEIKPDNANPHLSYDTDPQHKYTITVEKIDGVIKVTNVKWENQTSVSPCFTEEVINTWHPESKSITLEIPVTKNIIAGEKDDTLKTADGKRTFSFKIEAIGNSPEPFSKVAHIDFNRNAQGELQLSKENKLRIRIASFDDKDDGEYYYKVYEQPRETGVNPGYVYDNRTYVVVVKVYHGVVTASYQLDGEDVDKIEFNNKYYPPVSMPSAGGTGINNYFQFGGMLVIVGGCWLTLKKLKKANA